MLGKNNANPEELLDDAIEKSENGDYEEAVKSIDMAISLVPRNPEYHLVKADILYRMEDFEGALNELNFSETLGNRSANLYSLKSLCFGSMGDYEKSLDMADKAISVDPDYAYAYYNRALALRNMGKYKEAIEAYKKAIEKNPSDVDAHLDLGEIYYDDGEYRSALMEAKNAIKYSKANRSAHDLKIKSLLRLGDAKEYLNAMLVAYRDTRDEEYIGKLVEEVMLLGGGEAAEGIAKEFLDNNRKNPYFNDLLARVYFAEGKKEESEKLYRNFIAENHGIEITRYWINYLYDTEKYEEALNEADEGIKKYPDSIYFKEMRFKSLRNLNRHEEAVSVIKDLYEKHKEIPDYGLDYASELAVLKKYDDAISVLNDLQKEYDDYSEVYIEFFRVFNEKGDFESALNYASIAMEKADDEETLLHFPEEVIDAGLKASKIKEIREFLDDLISGEEEGSIFRLVYSRDKAIITGATEGYEKGSEEMKGISKDKNMICLAVNMHTEIENENALKFLNEFKEKECADQDKDEMKD